MEDYEHTQPGTALRIPLGGIFLTMFSIALFMFFSGHKDGIYLTIAPTICGIALLLFHSLTVRVTQNTVDLIFGIGLIRKSLLVADIEDVSVVRNPWYYFWGIKKIPGGWLYNVSGLDAVEIRHRNGRKYRIGTDRPERLFDEINLRLTGSK